MSAVINTHLLSRDALGLALARLGASVVVSAVVAGAWLLVAGSAPSVLEVFSCTHVILITAALHSHYRSPERPTEFFRVAGICGPLILAAVATWWEPVAGTMPVGLNNHVNYLLGFVWLGLIWFYLDCVIESRAERLRVISKHTAALWFILLAITLTACTIPFRSLSWNAPFNRSNTIARLDTGTTSDLLTSVERRGFRLSCGSTLSVCRVCGPQQVYCRVGLVSGKCPPNPADPSLRYWTRSQELLAWRFFDWCLLNAYEIAPGTPDAVAVRIHSLQDVTLRRIDLRSHIRPPFGVILGIGVAMVCIVAWLLLRLSAPSEKASTPYRKAISPSENRILSSSWHWRLLCAAWCLALPGLVWSMIAWY